MEGGESRGNGRVEAEGDVNMRGERKRKGRKRERRTEGGKQEERKTAGRKTKVYEMKPSGREKQKGEKDRNKIIKAEEKKPSEV